MKNRLLALFVIFFALQNIFSQEYKFISSKDIVVENANTMTMEKVKGNTLLTRVEGQPFYFSINDNFFGLGLTYNECVYFVNADLVSKLGEKINLPETIKKSYWIMNYYYDSLFATDIDVILDNETYLKSDEINRYSKSPETWDYYFSVLMYKFGDFYFYARHNWEYGDLNVFANLISANENIIVYDILETECFIFDKENKDMWQPEYRSFYEKRIPFKIYLVQDGDYLDLYINSISEENHLYTLARADDETIEQITNLVKQKECDLSRITWPRHADGTCDYEVREERRQSIGNIYRTTDNLRLRSSEATSSAVITTMQKETRVKILQLGQEQIIDCIKSNWVQVEVLSGAKDRDGNPINPGTAGWCFGGFLTTAPEPEPEPVAAEPPSVPAPSEPAFLVMLSSAKHLLPFAAGGAAVLVIGAVVLIIVKKRKK